MYILLQGTSKIFKASFIKFNISLDSSFLTLKSNPRYSGPPHLTSTGSFKVQSIYFICFQNFNAILNKVLKVILLYYLIYFLRI